MLRREAHVGEHAGIDFIHEGGELHHSRDRDR
jgi:hypothetical protein